MRKSFDENGVFLCTDDIKSIRVLYNSFLVDVNFINSQEYVLLSNLMGVLELNRSRDDYDSRVESGCYYSFTKNEIRILKRLRKQHKYLSILSILKRMIKDSVLYKKVDYKYKVSDNKESTINDSICFGGINLGTDVLMVEAYVERVLVYFEYDLSILEQAIKICFSKINSGLELSCELVKKSVKEV